MISEPHSRPLQIFFTSLKLAWRVVCIPVYTVLVILEPFVRFFLSALTVAGVLTAIGAELALPDLPFWTLMATALSFGALLAAYYLIMRLFRPR